MVILKEGTLTPTVKKTTQGRKKIDIKIIINPSNRQVTFCKRRVGLFKKASELCILCGAEVAIIVLSQSKRVFAFGHPTADSIVDRFLSGGDGDGARDNLPAAKAGDYNRHYSDVCKELEAEKKQKEVIEEAKRVDVYGGGGWGYWWDEAVDGLELEELELYSAALEELMKNVTMRADDLMLIHNSSALPAAGPSAAAGGGGVGSFPLDNTAMAFMNQNPASGGASNDYGNCLVPYGFESEEQASY